jgi:hypothetical protein
MKATVECPTCGYYNKGGTNVPNDCRWCFERRMTEESKRGDNNYLMCMDCGIYNPKETILPENCEWCGDGTIMKEEKKKKYYQISQDTLDIFKAMLDSYSYSSDEVMTLFYKTLYEETKK